MLRMPACRLLSSFSLLVALGAIAPGCQPTSEDPSWLSASTEALPSAEDTPCSDDSDCGSNGSCDPTQGGICDYPPCPDYSCGGPLLRGGDAGAVGPSCCTLGVGQMEAMMCKQQAEPRLVRLDRWCFPPPVPPVPPVPPPPPSKKYVCFCKTPGAVGDILCVNGNWTCVNSRYSPSGWATSCTGAGSTQSDTDLGGQACNGNSYTGFPDQCPNLTNTPANGTWQCYTNLVADAGTPADAGMNLIDWNHEGG
jgi:hypothetical protein